MKQSKEIREHYQRITSMGGKKVWENTTKEQRSAEMARRRALGIQRKKEKLIEG